MDEATQSGAKAYVPELPLPISCITVGASKRYMLYNIQDITWLRAEHHILGVMLGTLPQAPAQNVFMGLPLMLMPEEARLLVDKQIAYVFDERAWLQSVTKKGIEANRIQAYNSENQLSGLRAAQDDREVQKLRALKGAQKHAQKKSQKKAESGIEVRRGEQDEVADDILFGPPEPVKTVVRPKSESPLVAFAITPATAGPLASRISSAELPAVNPSAYAIFRLLHDQGYFLSPGMRFGCQFTAYPGDPLRYHSHFLTVSADWDEEIDLLNIIGGGRLATAVKKSFLLGGIETTDSGGDGQSARAYSLEWAGF